MDVPPFCTADQLRAWRDDDGVDVRLFDVRRSPDGSEHHGTYLQGHLSGAVYVDLDEVLADPPTPDGGRHPLPEAAEFAGWLRAHGVSRRTVVVALDTFGGAFAGRMVWMLRVQGIAASVLVSGLEGFEDELVSGEEVWDGPEGDVAFASWPGDAVAGLAEVAAHDGVLVDARAAERFRGDVEPLDPVAGHVPGAVNVPFAGNLDGSGLLAEDGLRARFATAGVTEGTDVIVYCGSGVTACHDALAMEQVGLPRPRVFVGSWSAWCADPSREVATGD